MLCGINESHHKRNNRAWSIESTPLPNAPKLTHTIQRCITCTHIKRLHRTSIERTDCTIQTHEFVIYLQYHLFTIRFASRSDPCPNDTDSHWATSFNFVERKRIVCCEVFDRTTVNPDMKSSFTTSFHKPSSPDHESNHSAPYELLHPTLTCVREIPSLHVVDPIGIESRVMFHHLSDTATDSPNRSQKIKHLSLSIDTSLAESCYTHCERFVPIPKCPTVKFFSSHFLERLRQTPFRWPECHLPSYSSYLLSEQNCCTTAPPK